MGDRGALANLRGNSIPSSPESSAKRTLPRLALLLVDGAFNVLGALREVRAPLTVRPGVGRVHVANDSIGNGIYLSRLKLN